MCNVYNTPMNTAGIGDPVPFGCNSYGSGDNFGLNLFKGTKSKISSKKPVNNLFNPFEPRPLIVMSNKK